MGLNLPYFFRGGEDADPLPGKQLEDPVYFADENPPHFHILARSGAQAQVNIRTLEVFAGSVPAAIEGAALKWAAGHAGEIAAEWARCNKRKMNP